jgi:hypothetical protein
VRKIRTQSIYGESLLSPIWGDMDWWRVPFDHVITPKYILNRVGEVWGDRLEKA